MASCTSLAYATLAEVTSADALLYGNFRYPESNDVVIVRGKQLALYTLLSRSDDTFVPFDRYDVQNYKRMTNTDGECRYGRFATTESLRFISETTLMDAPLAAHVLHDGVFHSYHRINADIPSTLDEYDPTSPVEGDAVHPEPSRVKGGYPFKSYKVYATSALALVFENGRVLVCAFNTLQNAFVTLSLHVIDQRVDAKDDSQYSSLPLGDKQRLTSLKETHVSVCQLDGWRCVYYRTIGKQRFAVYEHRFVIALCHNERIVYLIPLISEFLCPATATEHQYQPFSEHQEGGVRPSDTEHHSMFMVPWLRMGTIIEFDVDLKLGLCDGRYFVRGLDVISDANGCILGLLLATKPETVGTHVVDGVDYVIGGMSFVAVALNSVTRRCNVVQRIDRLPMDTVEIMGVPRYLHGAPTFIFRSLDFVMWVTLMSPTLFWQFVSPVGLLNTNFDNKENCGHDFVFLNAMQLNLDIRDHMLAVAGDYFVLVPRKRGSIYIGKPVSTYDGTLQDIFWSKLSTLDFEISSSQFVTVDDNLEFLATGSGVSISRFSVTLPSGFVEFDCNSNKCDGTMVSCEIAIPEIPTRVLFKISPLYESFIGSIGDGSFYPLSMIANHGAVRDPKNVSLPELWQVGCIRPAKGSVDEDQSARKSRIAAKFKAQRRPYAVNDRQVIEVATVDYLWPQQQSLIGVCDDSKLVVLMEKYPLHTVISVPLQSSSVLLPLEYTSVQPSGDAEHLRDTRMLVTWKDRTAPVTLNDDLLCIQGNHPFDRRKPPQNESVTDPGDLELSTDERTLVYATVLGNTFAVQITPKQAIFIDLVENKRVCSKDLTCFDDVSDSIVCLSEVSDDHIFCMFSSGNVCVIGISHGPTLALKRKIGGGIVRYISLYRPKRVNNVFGGLCLLVLTSKDMLFCYRMDNFTRIFAFSGITQVFPQLFNEDSLCFDMEEVEEDVVEVSNSGSNCAVGKRTRGSKPAATKVDLEETCTKKGRTKGRKTEPITKELEPCLSEPSDIVSQEYSQPSQEFVSKTISRWKKAREHEYTFEYVLSIKMLDVSPTDLGPTLVILMTGRPLLIYRSYLLAGKDYVFQLFPHKFVNPIPSAVAKVDGKGSSQQLLLMRLRKTRAVEGSCISGALLTHVNLDQFDVNHVTVSYPHISAEDAVYYLVGAESNELSASAKPLARTKLVSTPELKCAMEVHTTRWKNFRPPSLRLTSVGNRLRLHEYDMENAIDVETVLGDSESRVTSLYSVVTHSARYIVFLTLPGSLVLCVPGSLHQDTSINGDLSLQEIIAGSDEPEYLSAKRPVETTYNPLYCRLRSDDWQVVSADLSCRRLSDHAGGLDFTSDFISQKYHLGDLHGGCTAVSHKNYYLSKGVIRANRNATIATLPSGSDIHAVFCGKLVGLVVRKPIPARQELVGVLNDRINLQLRQLESEQLPPGTKPIDIIEPNKQICTLIQTLDLLPKDTSASEPLWRDTVLIFHMGDLQCWYGEYVVEPMESVLSLTFGIIGNREYLLVGTCTNLGENVESKGDVVVIDLQSLFQKQRVNEPGDDVSKDNIVRRSPNCVTLNQYCKRIFPGPVTFLSSLNTDFDLIFRPNFRFHEDVANIVKSENVMIYGNEDSGRWTVTHFSPNFGLFVHSVGPRLFVHEVSGRQFLRGAFAEVPLCVSSACVFDKYVVACDLNQGVHFFMYRHDAVNDSRTLCKISSTVKKVDLSVVACAPLVNSDALGLVISDYYGNMLLFRSESEKSGRETLIVSSGLRLPTRVTHFVRRQPDFRHIWVPSGVLGFCADGSVLSVLMPESQSFQFFKSVQSAMESLSAVPLGVPRAECPLYTSQMSQTQAVWPGDEAVLHLDVLRQLPFRSASFLSNVVSKLSEDGGLLPYQLLNAMYSTLLSV
ncbi:uncharacterized protein BXIN_0231 [Babesia sp. Xinjiang]|uniref:uncharacterized protein n=1 Tax=Babesia sp. Xinjiang TaxID=462227 RepID=UPI000A23BD8B|nr:uncharacterized protein BXIN_0231 [Babesia sp. Xinjiang]ORM39875.1 hypothetical protein BXIN_0231 [Babesia sp. Xinjiang]